MVIQLTKTKSITIGGGAKKAKRKSSDVVGIDMFGGDTRGFPSVRLAFKKDQIKVVAAGFVPAPDGQLPATWEEAAKNPIWTLPSDFQAPHAAFTLSAPGMFLAQTTLEAVKTDVLSGGHQGEDTKTVTKTRRFGIRRDAKKADEKKEAPQDDTVAKIDVSAIQPGVPISNGGTRFVMKPMAASDGFVMEAGMPEYQALWLSRLLPEGRRPTVVSIQPRQAALTASVLRDPGFLKANGTGLALFLGDEESMIAGFKDRDLILWRKCRLSSGRKAIRTALVKGLGVDEEMLDGIMNDNLIDPRPVLEGVLAPLLEELTVSRDYLAGKLGMEIQQVFVSGLTSGINYWNAIATDHARLTLTECKPFAGLDGALPEADAAGAFTAALGAALALMAEDDE